MDSALLQLVAVACIVALPSLQGLLADSTDSCSTSFYMLERSLLESPDNRLNLLRAYFPPREAHPVLVRVNYTFGVTEQSQTWFWSESEFYLIQPLEVFQFTSLLFSNMPYRQSSVSLELDSNCSSTPLEYLQLLTTRVSVCVVLHSCHAFKCVVCAAGCHTR